MRVVLIAGCLAASSLAFASKAHVMLSRGTVIPVVLSQNLSSDHSLAGDTFTCRVQDGYMDLPAGTRVRGVVTKARPKTSNEPGALGIEFTSLLLPNGKPFKIDGSPSGLDDKSVKTSSGGRLVAKNGSGNQRLTYVGYGAGAGFALSVLGGGNKVKNTLLGAGVGYLAGSLMKSDKHKTNNVLLKSGSKIGVLIQQNRMVRW